MKVYRGKELIKTDEKSLSEWKPGQTIVVDGTKDKSGMKYTQIGIEIDENDIASLITSLIAENKRIKKSLQEVRDALIPKPMYLGGPTVEQLDEMVSNIRKIVYT